MPDGLAALIGKDRSGDVNCYFAVAGFFSRARTRMTCNLATRLQGRNDAFRPYQEGRFCVMLSVPLFARFGGF